MGLFDFLGGGHPGNDEIGQGQQDWASAGQDASNMDAYGHYNQGVYNQYAPQQLQALQGDINYNRDRMNYGLTQSEQNQLMGGWTGGAQAGYDGANAAVDLNNMRRGISPDSSTAQGAYAANASNAVNSYMQARQQLGAANLQAKAQGRQGVLNDYASIVDPSSQNMMNGYQNAAGIYQNVGNSLVGLGQQQNEYADQHSLGAALGGLAQVGGEIWGMSRGMPKAAAPAVASGTQSIMTNSGTNPLLDMPGGGSWVSNIDPTTGAFRVPWMETPPPAPDPRQSFMSQAQYGITNPNP